MRKSKAKYTPEERHKIKLKNLEKGRGPRVRGEDKQPRGRMEQYPRARKALTQYSPRVEFLNAESIHDFEDDISYESEMAHGSEDPEKVLVRAVIYRAIVDACSMSVCIDRDDKREAREWLESHSTKIYSYNWCCDHVGISDHSREVLRQLHKKAQSKGMMASQRSNIR